MGSLWSGKFSAESERAHFSFHSPASVFQSFNPSKLSPACLPVRLLAESKENPPTHKIKGGEKWVEGPQVARLRA